MVTRSFPEKVSDWEILIGNLRPVVEEKPHFTPLQAELEALIAEAKSLELLQDQQRAALRDTNKKRRDVEKRGGGLRGRLAAMLQAELGFDNQRLLEFGVKPRRPPVRRKKTPEPPPPAPPASAAPPPTAGEPKPA